MFKHIQNQRGGALIYVLMIFMVITITTPLIILSNSSTPIQNQKSVAHRQANNLSLSALEAYISYLKAYNSSAIPYESPITYFNAYPIIPYKFVNPENQNVTVTLHRDPDNINSNLLKVTAITTVVGAGVNEKVEHSYEFNTTAIITATPTPVTTPVGTPSTTTPTPGPTAVPTPFIDPTYRTPVSSTPEKFYVQGSRTGTAVTAVATTQPNLSPAIANAIANEATLINNQISLLDTKIKDQMALDFPTTTAPTPPPTSFTCISCASVVDITTAINTHLDTPIYVPNTVNEGTVNSTATWGSLANNVELYMNDLTFYHGGNITIYGNAYFNNITFNDNISSLTVYGKLSFNKLIFDKSGSIIVTKDIMVRESLTFNGDNSSTLNATGNILVKNTLTMNAKTNNSISAKNLYVLNNLILKVKTTASEMLYVRGNLTTESIPVLTVGKSLYTTGTLTMTGGGTYRITDNLAVIGDIIYNGSSKNISANNMYTKNALTVNDGGIFNLSGTLYSGAGETKIYGKPAITVNKFVTNNTLTMTDGVNLTVNQDMLVKSAIMYGTPKVVNIPNGDFFVQNDFTMSDGIQLTAGGNVAIGGNFTAYGTLNIDVGGQTSSLHLTGASPTPSPTPTPTPSPIPVPTPTPVGWEPSPTPSFVPHSWKPVRKS